MTRRPCIIVDLDGTVADNSHRLHYLKSHPPDWEQFLMACKDDKPFPYMLMLLRFLSGHVKIFLVTSRPERFRLMTNQWFIRNQMPNHELLMRPNDDYRDDCEFKLGILHSIIDSGYTILFAIDDRPTVVRMFRENGVPCLVTDDSGWREEWNLEDLKKADLI